MKILKKLSFRFSNEEMEKGYQAVREENVVKDFNVCLAFYMFTNCISITFAIMAKSFVQISLVGGSMTILLLLFCLQRYLKKQIKLVTLFMCSFHNIITLLLFPPHATASGQTRLFFFGYGFAMIQGILILRLYQLTHKIISMIIALIMRFVYVNCVIEPGSFIPLIFIRHFVIDAFIIYTICTYEWVLRKIYQSFVQKKEELLKFKELIAESLPQSLVVVTYGANDLLFCNNAFHNTFDHSNTSECADLMLLNTSLKQTLDSLIVERSTIRETGTNDCSWTILDDLDNVTPLKEILEKMNAEDSLSSKTVSLSASITKKASRKLFEITLKNVKWDSADSIAIIFNDITYQESLIALKLANINKDKVIATVSHELRTPLNGIIGILDIAEKKMNDNEVTGYLSLCKDNANLLLSLVNSILDLQQISIGKLRLNLTKIDIRKTVNSITRLFSFQCKQKNITLDCEVHSEVSSQILTDENRLKQILINIVGNAVKFTSKGGVKIEVVPFSENPEKLQFIITDTGNGIKEENQRHLFKMYNKIEDEEGVNKNGVGLGLTIANALVLLLNDGSDSQGIKFETQYRIGSKFYFEIQKHFKEKEFVPQKKKNITFPDKIALSKVSNVDKSETAKEVLQNQSCNCTEAKMEEDKNDSREVQKKDFDELFGSNNMDSKIRDYASFKKNKSSFIRDGHEKILQDQEITLQKEDQQRAQPSGSILRQKALLSFENCNFDIDILIVDDNPFNLLVAQHLLQEIGCKIKTALSGHEAIELVQKSFSEGVIFKVIFMDCQMPIMDGFETTKVLKLFMKNGKIPDIPIYAWTANNSEEDVNKCYEAGMIGHVPKPASKLDIMKIISGL